MAILTTVIIKSQNTTNYHTYSPFWRTYKIALLSIKNNTPRINSDNMAIKGGKKSTKTVFMPGNRAVTTGKRARQTPLCPFTSSKRAATTRKSPSRRTACPQRCTKSAITTSARAYTSSKCPSRSPACPQRCPACPATCSKRARESSIYGNLLNSILRHFKTYKVFKTL